jgi:5-methylcytosine-specific restriction endonuclease McrA
MPFDDANLVICYTCLADSTVKIGRYSGRAIAHRVLSFADPGKRIWHYVRKAACEYERGVWETVGQAFGEELDQVRPLIPVTRDEVSPQTERGKVTNGLRYDVLKRDGFHCQACGATGKTSELEVDHITPVSKGGKTEMKNLQTLCFECNSGKGDKT